MNIFRKIRDKIICLLDSDYAEYKEDIEELEDSPEEFWAPKFKAGDHLYLVKDRSLRVPEHERKWYRVIRLLPYEYLIEDSVGDRFTQGFRYVDKDYYKIVPTIVTKVDHVTKSITLDSAPSTTREKKL